MLELNEIYLGDCLEVMKEIDDKSIDMILCDLPYGTTACKWDNIINIHKLWQEYKRIIKDNNAIVLTGMQPFTTLLISSNLDMYKYNWIWNKKKPGAIGIAKYQPLRYTEDIIIFSKKTTIYNPQMINREKIKISRNYKHSEINAPSLKAMTENKTYTQKYPSNIIEISNADQHDKVHPTQKPVALFEYLIKTYTNPGMVVLDNCIGSGTTAIACLNTARQYIGIEKDEGYFKIAQDRIKKWYIS